MHNQLDHLAREHLADMRRTADHGHLARRATPGAGRAIPRALLVIGAVALLGFAFTGAASAQTTSFQANVTATMLRGGGTVSSAGCSNGAYSCGTANIAGYGAASWNLYATSATAVVSSCDSTYTATTYFTLASDPTSTLVIDESGYDCVPGLDGNGYFAENPDAWGHPFINFGTWTIDTTDSTGQFAGLL
ncbi:MAG TPA: hypothetical protein VGI55_11300, partial [Solirubrobacteraceae bacterium]